MEIQEVLKILKDGAEKPKNKESDYLKAKSDGLMEAYSHSWTLVKNLSLSGLSKRSELLLDFMSKLDRIDIEDLKDGLYLELAGRYLSNNCG